MLRKSVTFCIERDDRVGILRDKWSYRTDVVAQGGRESQYFRKRVLRESKEAS